MENTLAAINRRRMLIVWSWRQGSDHADTRVWSVEGKRRDQDLIICADRPASPQNEQWLIEQTTAWSQEGDVFVFLHRRHGYQHKTIQKLLSQRPNNGAEVRYFLFGEGSDAIYLAQSSRGLLGTTGTFSGRYKNGDQEDRPLSAVFNDDEGLLLSSHFNYVWHFYQGAFKSRVFELKEDLFAILAGSLTTPVAAAGSIYQTLKQKENQVLLLRLLSFTGRLRAGSRLEMDLRQAEEQLDRSFRFDDASANLQNAYGIAAAAQYEELVRTISQDFLATGNPVDLRQLRDQFAALLLAMPGETYT